MKRGHPHEGGYILVAAILAIGLLFTAGLAVMARMTTEMKLGRNSHDHEQAWQSAFAGIEHCIGYLRWGEGRALMKQEITAPTSVCEGLSFKDDRVDYSVSAVAVNKYQVTITSVGKAGRSTRTLKGVLQYTSGSGTRGKSSAWGGGPLFWGGNGTIIGDIYSDATITFQGTPQVCGHLFAKVSINQLPAALPGCTNAMHYPVPGIEFPPFDLASLTTVANQVITGPHQPNCRQTNPNRGPECDGPTDGVYIVWVKGDLTFSSQGNYYTGRVIYIADGNISVKGQLGLAEKGLLQLSITGDHTIDVSAGNDWKKGIFVAPSGTFVTNGVAKVHGLVFARKGWNNTGNGDWIADALEGFCTHLDPDTGEVVCHGSRPSLLRLWEM